MLFGNIFKSNTSLSKTENLETKITVWKRNKIILLHGFCCCFFFWFQLQQILLLCKEAISAQKILEEQTLQQCPLIVKVWCKSKFQIIFHNVRKCEKRSKSLLASNSSFKSCTIWHWIWSMQTVHLQLKVLFHSVSFRVMSSHVISFRVPSKGKTTSMQNGLHPGTTISSRGWIFGTEIPRQ